MIHKAMDLFIRFACISCISRILSCLSYFYRETFLPLERYIFVHINRRVCMQLCYIPLVGQIVAACFIYLFSNILTLKKDWGGCVWN